MKSLLFLVLTGLTLSLCSASVASAMPNPSMHRGQPAGRPHVLNRRGRSSSGSFVFVSNDTQVGQGGTAEIDYWPAGSTGDVAPTGIIAGPDTGLIYGLEGVVVDSTGEIYVANLFTNTIYGFPPNANGDVAPNITIGGSNTGLLAPVGLALDSAGNLWVTNCAGEGGTQPGPNSIEEFAADSNGNVAPIRTIAGKRTGLNQPFGIAIDATGDIYVVEAATNEIDIFASKAHGNASPKRVIAGPDTKLNQPLGLGFGSDGLYVGSWPGAYLERFKLRASGNARPKAVVQGPQTQLNCCLDGIDVAPDGTVYVVDRGTQNGGSPLPSIIQFDPLAKRDVPPLTNITGPSTRLYVPLFVFVASQPSRG